MSSSWSITNGNTHLPRATWESFIDHHVAAGMMLGVLIVSLSYPVVNKIYMTKSSIYRSALTRDQQLVVVQHTIEAIFLGLICIPLSYLILSLFFEEQPSEQVANKFAAIATLMFVVIIMYLIEIASRFQNLRPLVVAHHLCAFFDSIYPAFFLTTANLKSASLLVYFITFEAITFVGLVMYRLAPSHRMTRPIIMSGMCVFGLTRPMQLVWIVGSLIATWDHLVVVHAVVQIVLVTCFTALQVYSLSFHYSLYVMCGKLSSVAPGEVPNNEKDSSTSISTSSPSLKDEELGMSGGNTRRRSIIGEKKAGSTTTSSH